MISQWATGRVCGMLRGLGLYYWRFYMWSWVELTDLTPLSNNATGWTQITLSRTINNQPYQARLHRSRKTQQRISWSETRTALSPSRNTQGRKKHEATGPRATVSASWPLMVLLSHGVPVDASVSDLAVLPWQDHIDPSPSTCSQEPCPCAGFCASQHRNKHTKSPEYCRCPPHLPPPPPTSESNSPSLWYRFYK